MYSRKIDRTERMSLAKSDFAGIVCMVHTYVYQFLLFTTSRCLYRFCFFFLFFDFAFSILLSLYPSSSFIQSVLRRMQTSASIETGESKSTKLDNSTIEYRERCVGFFFIQFFFVPFRLFFVVPIAIRIFRLQ